MRTKIIVANVAISVAALALMFALGLGVTENNYVEITEKKIKEITAIYAAQIGAGTQKSENSEISENSDKIRVPAETVPANFAFPQFVEDSEIRATLIDSAGRVLKDSRQPDVSNLPNHIDREEVVSALKNSPKVFVRESETTGQKMMYFAQKISVPAGDYVFVRVAVPVENIDNFIAKSAFPMAGILAGIWLLSAIASVLLSGILLKPLKQIKENLAQILAGNFTKTVPATDDADINEILANIDDLAENLQQNLAEITSEKTKLDNILQNVSDGIVVFDRELNVLIANQRAKSIFNVESPENLRVEALTNNAIFIDAIGDCATKSAGTIFQIELENRHFLTSVRCAGTLILAVLSDITSTKESEKIRLEFFANASHELKTPLTTIKGFNDLIALKNAGGNAEIAQFTAKIDKEIGRITNLLGDMLNLSKLENTAGTPKNLVPVNAREIANEVAENLKPLAEEKQVSLEIFGNAEIAAEPEHLYELIKNLAENSIRYNNVGGNVKIAFSSRERRPVLTVSDNGIGIDRAHQSRIFERFYRVDKSRSRATGGTGLGLAIVKHICELYSARLSLRSQLGAGTIIEIEF